MAPLVVDPPRLPQTSPLGGMLPDILVNARIVTGALRSVKTARLCSTVGSDPPGRAHRAPQTQGGSALMSTLASDLVIELENKPGALARVATAISDAGVNIAAATCVGNSQSTEVHILVPHSEPVYRALANTHGPTVTREREVVVVQAKDRPGELAELARMISDAGINLDIVYVATNSRVVLGSQDTETLKKVLDGFSF